MGKYWLDLKCLDSVPEAYQKSSKEIMEFTGINTGNLAFRHALRKMVKDYASYKVVDWRAMQSLLENGENVTHVIVSCANWLGLSEEDERSNGVRADIIGSIDAPVISFGLGAQAKDVGKEVKFGPNTERLAKCLSSKCNYLSVRDEFTQNSLEAMGIRNAVVTGCPSNFINHDNNLGTKIAAKAANFVADKVTLFDLRSSITEFSGGNKHSGQIINATLEVLRNSPSFYILQAPDLYPFLLRETNTLHDAYAANTEVEHKAGLIYLMKAKAMGFSSVDSWLDFSRTCDFSFGMRIHGNMIPIQAEVPSLLIAHDSRTSGLAQCMGVPSVTPEYFLEHYKKSPEKLYEVVLEKMAFYDQNRCALHKVWANYMSANSIMQSLSFQSMRND